MDGLVSVIIPVYKVEEYLDRCIESVANQTYSKLEIILVDDGSPDSCPDICDQWAAKDNRIVVIHKINEGLPIARNTALDVATGEYIMFLDSDDYISESAVMLMYNKMVETQSDMVIGDSVFAYPDGSLEEKKCVQQEIAADRETLISFIKSGDISFNRYACWGKLYKRELLKEIRFQELKFAEDMRFWSEVISSCERVVTISDTVHYYYQRSSSLMHTFHLDEEKKSHHLLAYLSVADVFERNGYLLMANNFYHMSLHMAQTLKSKKEARNLVNKILWKKRKGKFKNKDLKTLVLWMSMYVPIYKLLKRNHKN